jgi:hypothetical protein
MAHDGDRSLRLNGRYARQDGAFARPLLDPEKFPIQSDVL